MINWIDQNPDIPEATGYLKQSAQSVLGRSSVVGTKFEAYVGFDATYAQYVEQGRPPGSFPPVEAIRAWCVTVGIPPTAAEAIAWKIYHKGITPQPFWEATKAYAMQVLQEELRRAMLKYQLIATVHVK
jgi:hypothetical protein